MEVASLVSMDSVLVHVVNKFLVGINDTCPVTSSVDMYPVIELCVVLSAYSAYVESIHG